MKLGITGSRNITNFDFIPFLNGTNTAFKNFCAELGSRKFTRVITGGAKGIDTLAETAAHSLDIPVLTLQPDFEKYHGRLRFAAFLNRDEKIIQQADALLAVWNGDLSSHGTLYTMNAAIENGIPVFLVVFQEGRIVRAERQSEVIDYPGRKRWK